MTPERWRQVEALFHAALEQKEDCREIFLQKACQGDSELRQEVESLLVREPDRGLLDRPAWEAAPSLIESSLTPGTRLGPYEILAPIGAGGMGEVYRARDTRLNRIVAIKVSQERFSDRFEREARAVAALNHPNICTLYDVGPNYLVMEFIEGKSLDELIAPKGLPLEEAVGYATQIASALAAAHGAGIVHRDIKPANIIVNPEGHVKVLDFGLAKLEERVPAPNSETRTMESALTRAGVVMGTAAYMSPEQARAESVDARTDLFSFGAVLYEMVTGQRAFPKSFDWAAPSTAILAPELRHIVLKLLAANRELRYQNAEDVAADLKRCRRWGEGRRTSRRWWLAGAAAVVALAFTAGAILYLHPKRPAGRDQWVQLTNFPDSVSQPALSPDGRMLTFVRGPDTYSAPGQIYVKILPSGEPVQLTHDDSNKMSPVFSPDGARIAYTVSRTENWDTWVVPVLNGQPRLWLANVSGLIWLGDRTLLFSKIKDVSHMGIVTAAEDRAGERDVYLPESDLGMAHRSYPSPDEKSALVVEMQNGENGTWRPCRLVPLDGSSSGRPVGPANSRCSFAAWSRDGKWMYFSSNVNGAYHTWRERFPDGQSEQVTSGPTEEEAIAMDPDGRSFITSVALRQSVVSVHDANGERQISLEGYSYEPRFTPDGKKLCYRILKGNLSTTATAAAYPSELRIVDLNTGLNEALLPGKTIIGPPGLAYSISPDGQQVAVSIKDSEGNQRLWLAPLDRQSPPRQIPNVEGRTPYFGKSGEIFFRGLDEPAHAYRVREDGSGLRRLSEQPILGLHGASQDGRWVIAKVRAQGGEAFVALPVGGGAAVPTVPAEAASWSPDGTLLFVSEAAAPLMSVQIGRTYVIPLSPGQMLPINPPGGFKSPADLAKLPGVRIIDAYDAAPGPTPSKYAFSRATVLRNLYRIPTP